MPKSKDNTPPRIVHAWHFLNYKDHLRDGTPVHVGRLYRLPNGQKPKMCARGYHASERLIAALGYVAGRYLCRVELSGEFDDPDYPVDKLVASQRRILWMVHFEPIAREFLADMAEQALFRIQDTIPADCAEEYQSRCVESLAAARAYLRGELTDDTLALKGSEATDWRDRFARDFRTLVAAGKLSEQERQRLGMVASMCVNSLSMRPVHGLDTFFRYANHYRDELCILDATPDELNAQLEARVMAFAPATLPPPPKAKRWDRTKKLRKPLKPKKAKSELAQSLVATTGDHYELLERTLCRRKELQTRRWMLADNAGYASRVQVSQMETLVRRQAESAPMSDEEFQQVLQAELCHARELRARHYELYAAAEAVTLKSDSLMTQQYNALSPKQRKQMDEALSRVQARVRNEMNGRR